MRAEGEVRGGIIPQSDLTFVDVCYILLGSGVQPSGQQNRLTYLVGKNDQVVLDAEITDALKFRSRVDLAHWVVAFTCQRDGLWTGLSCSTDGELRTCGPD